MNINKTNYWHESILYKSKNSVQEVLKTSKKQTQNNHTSYSYGGCAMVPCCSCCEGGSCFFDAE